MSNYKRINDITGWVVFLIALIVYSITLEPTASFWDCGEFIACSYKLLVPHPPGAPLYLLIGRIFSMFATDVTKVAIMVNFLSAVSSAFTVLFLFWTITILAKKLVFRSAQELTPGNTILIMGSGAVGALAYTFSDSFWFSAVEAEVYAMSSFFTAFVFWAMLKWEARSGQPHSDKWLILIAYMMGLSIGVHLLNLVTVPALGFIYYYRQYKPSAMGALLTMGISAVIVILILWGVIPGLPSVAGSFEIFFKNGLGLPFGSGIIVFTILFVSALVFGIRYSIRQNMHFLNTALLCLVFILIGYSSYMIIPIRSAYNPPIDENDPENIVSFVSYLKREQYGDRPLLYGPQFNADVIANEEGAARYIKGKDKYIKVGHKTEQVYDPKDMALLPRLYSSQPHHIEEYKKWVNIREDKKPTMGQNLSFLMRYQLGHMYWRYFLWNFVGRDSDIQQAGVLWPTDKKEGLPERVAESKARNNFFMLPLILGLAGLFFQLKRDDRSALIVGLLFIFTGIAIVLYLNQPPIEPRERDYTFAGSFYAFAIWIGLGVMGLAELLRKALKSDVARAGVATLACMSVPVIMAAEGWDDHDRSNRYFSVDSAKNLLSSCAPNAILFTNGDNDTFPLWYAQEVEGFRTDVRVAVLSYLNTDWYVDQMKRRTYESMPLPISMENDNYRQGTNDYLPFKEQIKGSVDLQQFIGFVRNNDPRLQVNYGTNTLMSFPTKSFFLNVDKQEAARAVPADRQAEIVDRMTFTINKSIMEKKHLVILDILATNKWERPVYFSTTVNSADFMNLDPYFQLEGLAYRIVPVRYERTSGQGTGFLHKDIMYNNMMKKFYWRELDNPDIFYDENYLRFPANARNQFSRLAAAYMKDGDHAKAKEVIDYCLKVMPDESIPYDYYIPNFVVPLYQLGEQERAKEIVDIMSKRSVASLRYFMNEGNLFDIEIQTNLITLQNLIMACREVGLNTEAARMEQQFMGFYNQMGGR